MYDPEEVIKKAIDIAKQNGVKFTQQTPLFMKSSSACITIVIESGNTLRHINITQTLEFLKSNKITPEQYSQYLIERFNEHS